MKKCDYYTHLFAVFSLKWPSKLIMLNFFVARSCTVCIKSSIKGTKWI